MPVKTCSELEVATRETGRGGGRERTEQIREVQEGGQVNGEYRPAGEGWMAMRGRVRIPGEAYAQTGKKHGGKGNVERRRWRDVELDGLAASSNTHTDGQPPGAYSVEYNPVVCARYPIFLIV